MINHSLAIEVILNVLGVVQLVFRNGGMVEVQESLSLSALLWLGQRLLWRDSELIPG